MRVQERTVYRHFPKQEDLETAVWDWIVQHLTHADFAVRNEEQPVAAMRESFSGFAAAPHPSDAALTAGAGGAARVAWLRGHQQPGRRDRPASTRPADVGEEARAIIARN
jgi:hypothetical protein